MKIPDTIIAKVREIRAKAEVINDTLWYVNPFDIEQTLLDVRRETAQEISARFKAMQERYPEFCLNLFYDENSDYVFIKTTEYERIKPT